MNAMWSEGMRRLQFLLGLLLVSAACGTGSGNASAPAKTPAGDASLPSRTTTATSTAHLLPLVPMVDMDFLRRKS
jgi:hypothetical protein